MVPPSLAAGGFVMGRMRIRRGLAPHLAGLFLIAPLAVVMSTAPVSACATTRWVDKDGHAKNHNLADCKGQSNLVVSAASGNMFDANLGNSSNPAALCALLTHATS